MACTCPVMRMLTAILLKLLPVVCGQDHDQVLPAPPQALADLDPAMQEEHLTQSVIATAHDDRFSTDESAQLVSWVGCSASPARESRLRI